MPDLTYSPLQRWIMSSTADETFCGSERGASKTAATIALALLRITSPALQRYQAVFFRRRFTELKDTSWPQIRKWSRLLNLERQLHFTEGTDPRVTCKATGSELALSAASQESDVARYQGANKHLLIVDEPQNINPDILKLMSAVVRPDEEFRPQIFYMANPLGIGHAWLKRRFIDPARGIARDGNVHWGQDSWTHPLTGEVIPLKDHWGFDVVTNVDGIDITRTREVMLAGTKMNPVWDYRQYHAQLRDTLTDTYWQAWGENNWDLLAGEFFPELQNWVTSEQTVGDYDLIIASIDPGFRKTACVWLAVDSQGHYRIVDDAGYLDKSVDHIAPDLLAQHPEWEGRTIWIMDPAAEANLTSGRTTRSLYGDYGLHAVTRTHRSARGHGWNTMRAYGNDGRLKIQKNCEYTISSLEQLITDTKKSKSGGVADVEDCEKNHGQQDVLDGDHWADAARYALEFALLSGYDEPTLEQLRLQRAYNNPLVREMLIRSQR